MICPRSCKRLVKSKIRAQTPPLLPGSAGPQGWPRSSHLVLVSQGVQSEEFSAILSHEPRAEKCAKFWICKAKLLARSGPFDVMELYKAAISAGATVSRERRERFPVVAPCDPCPVPAGHIETRGRFGAQIPEEGWEAECPGLWLEAARWQLRAWAV